MIDPILLVDKALGRGILNCLRQISGRHFAKRGLALEARVWMPEDSTTRI